MLIIRGPGWSLPLVPLHLQSPRPLRKKLLPLNLSAGISLVVTTTVIITTSVTMLVSVPVPPSAVLGVGVDFCRVCLLHHPKRSERPEGGILVYLHTHSSTLSLCHVFSLLYIYLSSSFFFLDVWFFFFSGIFPTHTRGQGLVWICNNHHNNFNFLQQIAPTTMYPQTIITAAVTRAKVSEL